MKGLDPRVFGVGHGDAQFLHFGGHIGGDVEGLGNGVIAGDPVTQRVLQVREGVEVGAAVGASQGHGLPGLRAQLLPVQGWVFRHTPSEDIAQEQVVSDRNVGGRTWRSGDENQAGLPSVYTRIPLTSLLTEDDQPAAVRKFVADALADLKAVEIDRVIRDVCKGSGA